MLGLEACTATSGLWLMCVCLCLFVCLCLVCGVFADAIFLLLCLLICSYCESPVRLRSWLY